MARRWTGHEAGREVRNGGPWRVRPHPGGGRTARTASSAVTRSVSRFRWRMGVTQSRLVIRLRECDSLRAVIDGHGDTVFANCGLLVVRVIDSGIVDVRKSHVWIGSCSASALPRPVKSLG